MGYYWTRSVNPMFLSPPVMDASKQTPQPSPASKPSLVPNAMRKLASMLR